MVKVVDSIITYLKEIEASEDIEILLACETGSRAWGFPSPDSDYDVRLIYKHELNWYLRLSERKDTIERMLDDREIDISGWDLRKSLRLLQKSNPPLLERIQSPIVYRANEPFVSELNVIASQFYSRIANMHHYLSMAKKGIDEISGTEKYRLKKFFYTIRAAVACKWIVERNDIPPIVFQEMLNGLEIQPDIVQRIDELVSLKATKNESYLHSGENDLMKFISRCIELGETNSKSLPSAKGDLEVLNTFFMSAVIE